MDASGTFRDAYATPQKHVQTLRSQQAPTSTIVIESVEAYKICKQRIDAVEKALENALVEGDVDRGD